MKTNKHEMVWLPPKHIVENKQTSPDVWAGFENVQTH